MKKYTFDEEFHVKNIDTNLKKISELIIKYVKFEQIENIKVKVEITESKIEFKVSEK